MKVRFYTYSKRVNSTANPGPSDAYTVKDCLLKMPTSEHEPVIEIEGAINPSWNYCYIPDWSKLYFIREAVSVTNGLTQYMLQEDTLGTYKTAIRSTKQFVAFSSDSSVYDKYKIDSRLPVSQTKVVSRVTQSSSLFSSVGTYILSVYNNNAFTDIVGFATSYALTTAQMAELRQKIGAPTIWGDIATYMNGPAMSAILGCIWIPFEVTSAHGTQTTQIQIGNQAITLSTNAIRLNGYVTATESVALTLTGALRDDFRRAEPYTSGNLHLPGVGCIDVNLSDWITASQIQISTIFEIATGNVLYILRDPDGAIIQTASCCMAAQCPLGQITNNMQGVVSSVGGFLGGAAALATGLVNPALAAGAMLASGASAVLNANKRAPSISGHVGGRLNALVTSYELTIYEVQTENPQDSDYKALKGLPVGKVVALNTITGFCQCDGASVELAASAVELEEINRYLNEGFFIE